MYEYNYQATKDSIKNAMGGLPTAQQMIDQKDTASHPFKGF
ncbi:MAG: formaldehyde-activating enzyme [Pirellula sp.]